MLRIEPLTTGTVMPSAAVVAAEQNAALAIGVLSTDFADQHCCATALAGLLADRHLGVVAFDGENVAGVLCAVVRGAHAILPAAGLAIDPTIEDATGVLGAMYANVAPVLLASGAIHHHATHVDLEPIGTGLRNLGFGRSGVYASQLVRPARPSPDIEVRVAGADDLEQIVALSAVEMGFRFTPPIYAPPQPSSVEHIRERHVRLIAQGAVHLVARAERNDIGLLTLEFTSPAPRLCPTGQPYIGPTATHPSHRAKGVGRALVRAALGWADDHDFHSLSVDFDSANPLSRPFWLGAGFRPTGYQVTRSLDPGYLHAPPS